jgi:hypothetical protein
MGRSALWTPQSTRKPNLPIWRHLLRHQAQA